MADETTTTKWDVNHEPTNEDHESQRESLTRITTQQYKYSLLPPLTGGAESMIRIASDTIVLQSSACTLCLCVGRAWRSPSAYSLKPHGKE